MKRLIGFMVVMVVVECQGTVGFNRVGYVNVADAPGVNSNVYNGVAIDAQGRIVAVGRTDGPGPNGLIARYTGAGVLDTTFNAGSVHGAPGYVNAEDVPGGNDSNAYSGVAIDAQGRIVAVGQTDAANGLIARYTGAGVLDTTFNETGYVNVADAPGVNSLVYHGVAIDAQGRIVAVGATDNSDGLIARYTAEGVLDTTFNANFVSGAPGYVNAEDVPGGNDSNAYSGVAIDAQGRIVVVGQTDAPANGLIARYTAAGVLDTTFNGTGYVNVADAPGVNSLVYHGVAIDAQGRIVVVGVTGATDGLIARYTAAGLLDATFNGTGYVNVADGAGVNSDYYSGVAIDAQGRIVAVGRTGATDGLIARYTTAGVLDTTFNAGSVHGAPGYVNAEDVLGGNNSGRYVGVAIDGQGKIVAVGATDASDGLIARYLSNGVLDAENNWNVKNYRESCKSAGISIGLLSAA